MDGCWQQVFEEQMALAKWGPCGNADERVNPRVSWSGHVVVRSGRAKMVCPAIDLSEGGLRVAARRGAFVGQKVTVTFELFGRTLYAVGQVTWSGVGLAGRTWGIRFTALRQCDQQRIVDYIVSRGESAKLSRSVGPGTRELWCGGETAPMSLQMCSALLPGVPDYVPVRTGHTVSVGLPTPPPQPLLRL